MLRHRVGESESKIGDQRLICGAKHPRTVALGDSATSGAECLRQRRRRIRSGRNTEALVRLLVCMKRCSHCRIGRMLRCPRVCAVVGQHGIERGLSCGDGASETSNESLRAQIEQCRCRHEIRSGPRSSGKRRIEILGEIRLPELHVDPFLSCSR